MFCTPDFDRLAALFCSGDGLKLLFLPDCHCFLFHVCLLCWVSRQGRVFLRVVSKIHGHYIEPFSHLEIGFDKYAILWGAYILSSSISISILFWGIKRLNLSVKHLWEVAPFSAKIQKYRPYSCLGVTLCKIGSPLLCFHCTL